MKIQVKENEEYLNSIKKDIESIVINVIKFSTLKDYTVVVERLDLSFFKETEQWCPPLIKLTGLVQEGVKPKSH